MLRVNLCHRIAWLYLIVSPMFGDSAHGSLAYRATDELGHETVEHKVPLYNLYVSMLSLLHRNHARSTCCYAGREFRLTDGNAVHDIVE